jgi:hypothetical protein
VTTQPSGPATTEAGRAILLAAEAIVMDAASRDRRLLGARIRAIGWATVDLARAERELGEALGLRLEARPHARERKLGARTWLARPFGDSPALLLMEPDTEGRLAAILARHGEGVAMVVVEADAGTRRLALTSGRGGRSPRAIGDRPPSAAG